LRILLLADALEASWLDEPALWLHGMAARWVARGHQVQVICVQPLESWQEAEDPPGLTVWRPERDAFEAMLGEALAMEPDVVHVASAGPYGPRVVEILRELPVLLDVHDDWPVCPNHDLLRRPSLEPCGEHYPFAGCGPCAGLSRLRAMEEKVELASSARMVVAHSAYNRVRLGTGLGRPVELVPYGVDPSRFREHPEPPIGAEVQALWVDRERPRVVFLGPPSHARGAGKLLDIMVAVSARVPDVEFVVAGRDPTNPDWDQVFLAEAHELGLRPLVRLLPRVPLADLPAFYASCRLAIAPLVHHEPGGLFLLQAMACGLPILASPLGAVQDLVRQGEEGLLVPPRELSAFANGISTLLLDPMARMVFGESARLRVVEQHDIERSAHALDLLYERMRPRPVQRAVA
jgi:glycosyltransferase involved in cell wall biosynthesis